MGLPFATRHSIPINSLLADIGLLTHNADLLKTGGLPPPPRRNFTASLSTSTKGSQNTQLEMGKLFIGQC